MDRILKGIDDAKIAMEACYCWQPIYEGLSAEKRNAHPTFAKIAAYS
ncbi:MAG: hypothetical protein ACK4GQ_04375 [Candidatus Hadarchaeales archaeon]